MSLPREKVESCYLRTNSANEENSDRIMRERREVEHSEGMENCKDVNPLEQFYGELEEESLGRLSEEAEKEKQAEGQAGESNEQIGVDTEKLPGGTVINVEQKEQSYPYQIKMNEEFNKATSEDFKSSLQKIEGPAKQSVSGNRDGENQIKKQSGEIKQIVLDLQQIQEKAFFPGIRDEAVNNDSTKKIQNEKNSLAQVSMDTKITQILKKIEGVTMEDIKYMSEKEINQCFLELKECQKNESGKKNEEIVSANAKENSYMAYPHMSNQNLIDAIYPWMEGEIEEEELITYTRKQLQNLYSKLDTLIQNKDEDEQRQVKQKQSKDTMMNVEPIKKKEKSKKGKKKIIKQKKAQKMSEQSEDDEKESSWPEKNESIQKEQAEEKKKKKRGRKKKQSNFTFEEDRIQANSPVNGRKGVQIADRKNKGRVWSDDVGRDIGEIRKVLISSVKPHLVRFVKEMDDDRLREMYLEIREEEQQQKYQKQQENATKLRYMQENFPEPQPGNQYEQERPSRLNFYQMIGEYGSDNDSPIITSIPRKTRVLNDYSTKTKRLDQAQLFHHLDGLLSIFNSDDNSIIKLQP